MGSRTKKDRIRNQRYPEIALISELDQVVVQTMGADWMSHYSTVALKYANNWGTLPVDVLSEYIHNFLATKINNDDVILHTGIATLALFNWRRHKLIYRLDPTFTSALQKSQGLMDLPTELILKPPASAFGIVANGYLTIAFFSSFKNSPTNSELTFASYPIGSSLRAGDIQYGVFSLPLDKQTIGDCISAVTPAHLTEHEITYQGLLVTFSTILYLQSANADTTPAPLPRDPNKTKSSLYPRAVVNVGYRVGPLLKHSHTTSKGTASSRRSPTTHIRRAHWHTYRVGVGHSDLALRWIAPIVVGGTEITTPKITRI